MLRLQLQSRGWDLLMTAEAALCNPEKPQGHDSLQLGRVPNPSPASRKKQHPGLLQQAIKFLGGLVRNLLAVSRWGGVLQRL